MYFWLVMLAVVMACIGTPAQAQEMEPRAYSPSPVGMTFLGLSWQRSSGGVTTDPTLPITNVDAEIDSAIVGVVRTFGLGGRSASVGLLLPYTRAEVNGEVFEESRSAERSGLADARLRLAVNLLGSPALDRAQFARRIPGTSLGASLVVIAPTGEYDNDAFYGDSRREQDPLTTMQAHIGYTFRPQLWIAANATWYAGGRTTVDSIRKADRQETTRLGLTLSMPLTGGQSLKVAWSDGASTRIGSDFTTWTVVWQFAW